MGRMVELVDPLEVSVRVMEVDLSRTSEVGLLAS
jgi:hypothetical protein